MPHVTLIRTALVSSDTSYSNPLVPPLGLAYLAAGLLEDGAEVTALDAIGQRPDQFIREDGYLYQGLTIDELVEQIPSHTDLIGITCMFTQDWPYTRRVLRAIRDRFPETTIVAGGEHVTALPDFTLSDCPEVDYLALGEGEETLVEMTRDLGTPEKLTRVPGLAYRDGGKMVLTPARKRIREVDAIPLPAWDLFPVESYLESRNAHGVYRGRPMPILGTRGCPYECTFCSNPVMYGRQWLPRKVSAVLDEIELYIDRYKADNIDFYDLTMILKKDWILQFCSEIERRKLKFSWQLPSGTRSEVIDDEIAEALYRTGCRNMTYAPESGSTDTLARIKKKVSLPRLMSSVRSALRSGLNVKCNLIIGFPHETRAHIIKTVLFAWEMAAAGVHDVPFYLYSPYPGSELFDAIYKDDLGGRLDKKYFRSLTAYMDIKESSDYCPAVSAKELRLWRLFGMMTFYGFSLLIRPWRLIQLVRNIWNEKSETVLEQRLGAMLRRTTKAPTRPARDRPAPSPERSPR